MQDKMVVRKKGNSFNLIVFYVMLSVVTFFK